MKTAALAVLAAAASAVEVRPAPGMDLDPPAFADLRLSAGVAAPLGEATIAGGSYDMDPAFGPRLGLQWVRGRAGSWIGAALGIELAYEDARGDLDATGAPPGLLGHGEAWLRSLAIGVVPKLVLRPDYDDPFDWGPGTVHVEIGALLAAGVGWARLPGRTATDPAAVLRWGLRLEAVWTDPDTHWQAGATLAWEWVAAEPEFAGGDGAIGGHGVCGGLILGRRL